MSGTLTHSRLVKAAKSLAKADADLARILQAYGPPPLWARDPGFATLVRIILEQQVSLASADAMYARLSEKIEPLAPAAILAAGGSCLRALGVTRQKAGYFINLSKAIENGELELEQLEKDDDEVVIRKLTHIKGIGPWTAKVYLLMALRRPDVWPLGDIALASAFARLKGWQNRPMQAELSEIAKAWRPHRATAARMLWHFYLSEKTSRK